MNIISLPLNEIYSVENFPVVEFKNIDDIPFDIDSLLNTNSLIQTDNGSYLLKSKNLTTSQLRLLKLESQYYTTDYPTNINFSFSTQLEEKLNYVSV